METGPVDVYIIGFPGNKFTGRIAPAIAELVDNGTIRVLDLLFVMKDADGVVTTLAIEDLDQEGAAFAGSSACRAPERSWPASDRRNQVARRQTSGPPMAGTDRVSSGVPARICSPRWRRAPRTSPVIRWHLPSRLAR